MLSSAEPDPFDIGALVLLCLLWLYWMRRKRVDRPSLTETLGRPILATPLKPGLMGQSNLLAAEYCRKIFFEPDRAGWETAVLWFLFWSYVLFASSVFMSVMLKISGVADRFFPRWIWVLYALAAICFVLLLLVWLCLAAVDRIQHGKPIFWESRAREALVEIKRQHAGHVQYIVELEPIPLPWWWSFSVGRLPWVLRAGRALVKAVMIIFVPLLALYATWRGLWPGIGVPPVAALHSLIWIFVESVFMAYVGLSLRLQSSDFRGAEWRKYPTFALAVLQQALQDCPY